MYHMDSSLAPSKEHTQAKAARIASREVATTVFSATSRESAATKVIQDAKRLLSITTRGSIVQNRSITTTQQAT